MDGSGGARTGWVYDNWLRNGTTPDVTSTGAGSREYPKTDPQIYRKRIGLKVATEQAQFRPPMSEGLPERLRAPPLAYPAAFQQVLLPDPRQELRY